MDERVKRLRDALGDLVIEDKHAGDCRCVAHPNEQQVRCTCGYIARLSIMRRALADDMETIPPPAPQPLPNELGSEADLKTRWHALLYAEARLQRMRDEIIQAVEDVEVIIPPDPEPCMSVVAVDAATKHAVKERLMKLAEDQERPSPDFRALLLRAHENLVDIRPIVAQSSFTGEEIKKAVGAYKEALRVTDVERLAWAAHEQTIATIALRLVTDRAIDRLDELSDEPITRTFFTSLEGVRDELKRARIAPDDYFGEMFEEMIAVKRVRDGVSAEREGA